MTKFYVTGYAPRTIQAYHPTTHQISMEQCYAAYFSDGDIPDPSPKYIEPLVSDRFFHTRTKCVSALTQPTQKELFLFNEKTIRLREMLDAHSEILSDTSLGYETFHVPKKSGGLREINAPNEELKELQRDILRFFRNSLHMLCHDAAYAYIAGRGTKECMMVHQQNQSQWFLKLDIKDFFPSCSEQFVVDSLRVIHPLPFFDAVLLHRIISACALHGSLPQGAPSSPYLTNLIMVPYDYEITNKLWDYNKSHYVYTRYADDIIISSQYAFDSQQVIAVVEDILKDTPFRIKAEKTRYGSRAGRNWNLGLMLNKDNNLSLGHKFKQRFRAAVFSFLTDCKNQTQWQAEDVHQLIGWYSYFRNVEPDYANEIIARYEKRCGVSWYHAVRWMLN